ncbi:MAG: rRNA maturation RNase YbeY [Planctomycetota bacterium]|nr:MAG: rRNA maturation RNase YbeY [Planctomycetota bacterium]
MARRRDSSGSLPRRDAPLSRPATASVVVDIANRQRRVRIGSPWLERIVRRALRAEGVGSAEISILLVDDQRIAAIHQEWMNDPTATDVITFDLSDPPASRPDGERILRGDIVVSCQTAVRMAAEYGWTARQETAYYVLHGILHLTGHDDLEPVARRAMRRRERSLLASLGMPLPPRGRRPVRRVR